MHFFIGTNRNPQGWILKVGWTSKALTDSWMSLFFLRELLAIVEFSDPAGTVHPGSSLEAGAGSKHMTDALKPPNLDFGLVRNKIVNVPVTNTKH